MINLKIKSGDWPIIFLLAFFALTYSAWSVNRHNHFVTDAVDLSIFDQPIWHFSRGEAPLSSIKYNQFPGAHILGDHFHPILLTLAPLYWLWNDVRLLLIIQALAVVFAGWPIYKMAKYLIKNEFFSLALVFSFLTFIGIQAAIDWDFHETALAVLPLSFALYFLVTNNRRGYWLCFLLGLLFKEDMPLYFSAVGLFWLIKKRDYKLGLTTIFISIIYYLIVTQKLIPYFKGDRFAYEELDPLLGQTTGDLFKTALTSPWTIIQVILTPALKIKTILNYLASYAFLPLVEPFSLLLILPNIVARFLTQLPQRWLIRYQYGAILAPLLAFGTVYAVLNIQSLIGYFSSRLLGLGKESVIRTFRKIALVVISLALISAPLVQTFRTGTFLPRVFSAREYQFDENDRLNYELLKMIPKDPNVSVMAQSAFVPHLAHRQEIYRYEDTLLAQTQPQYILMSLNEHTDPMYTQEQLRERIENLRTLKQYEVIYWDGIRLLMKKIV
mgnify:CR=1 FL=1